MTLSNKKHTILIGNMDIKNSGGGFGGSSDEDDNDKKGKKENDNMDEGIYGGNDSDGDELKDRPPLSEADRRKQKNKMRKIQKATAA